MRKQVIWTSAASEPQTQGLAGAMALWWETMLGTFKAWQGDRGGWRQRLNRTVEDRRSDRKVGATVHGVLWALGELWAVVEVKNRV